jgi:Na+-driven multidrug efflux pump
MDRLSRGRGETVELNAVRRRLSSAWLSYPKDFMVLILLAWGIPAIYTLANTFYIGRMQMESIAISEQYENVGVILEILLEMFPIAVLALVARHMTDMAKVTKVVKSAFVMQLVITLAFMAVILAGTGLFVEAINTPAEIQDRTIAFLRVKALAMPFEALGLLFIIAIKAMRRGKLALGIAGAGVLLNFTLDSLFISNFSFSLKLGLMGSAWDYVTSKVVIFVVAGIAFFLTVKARPDLRFERKEVGEVFRIGKFSGLESAVRNAGYILGMLVVLNTLGTAEYGGYGIAMTIMWLIFLIPVLALGEATNVAIGNEYGKRNLAGMKDVQFVSLVLMGGYMVVVMIIGIFVWEPLSFFFNQYASNVEYSVKTFQYLAIPYIFFAIGSAMRSLLIGTGNTRVYLIPSAVVNLGIYIPLGLLVKASIYTPSFVELMVISFVVFATDLVIVTLLVIREYRKLERELPLKTDIAVQAAG